MNLCHGVVSHRRLICSSKKLTDFWVKCKCTRQCHSKPTFFNSVFLFPVCLDLMRIDKPSFDAYGLGGTGVIVRLTPSLQARSWLRMEGVGVNYPTTLRWKSFSTQGGANLQHPLISLFLPLESEKFLYIAPQGAHTSTKVHFFFEMATATFNFEL